MSKHVPIAIVVAALLANDIVTWFELRHAFAWLLGDLSPFAAASVLLLANAVTAAFFFRDLEHRYIRRLHLVAGYLYATIALAVYVSAVEHGRTHFPAEVAGTAFPFKVSPQTAVMAGSLVLGVALAAVTFVFWGVLGAVIRAHVERSERVTWRGKAEAAGLPTDNILDLQDRASR
jgi:hypothetical protein